MPGDVRALATLLGACIGEADEPAVADLLARASSDHDGFDDVRSFIAAWEDAVGTGDATSQVVGYTPTRNPYKGLAAFGELDAADFHGRNDLIAQLVTVLDDNGLVVAVGPSGIGKSSVVKAGLIPALRSGAITDSDRWLITTMVPGAFPFDELAAALLRVAVRAPSDLEDVLRKDARGLNRAVTRYLPPDATLVLVVDQFEELFTLCEDHDLRVGFLDTLVAATQDPHSRIKLVVTIRADFFDRPLAYGDFGALIQEATVPVTSPTAAQLDDIVQAPANGVGVTFEPGLPEHIVAVVKDQPGALPLLEFSLTELFDTRDTDVITVASYDASGGVKAALGRRAEETYSTLDPADQVICREIFLRMVTVNENGRDTRRRVRLTEIRRLGYDPQSIDRVLGAYTAHRLITFDRDPITRGPTVEVAHEAILTQWPRLAAWIEEHREDLLLRSQLAVAVADWETADRADTYLLTGGRLDQHETWTADTELTLTTPERGFLEASRTRENQQRTSRRRRRRLIMSGFGVAALIALVLAASALVLRSDAQNQAALAEENATEAGRERANAQAAAELARAGELAAIAADQIGVDPERSVLLAMQSLQTVETAGGVSALHDALQENRTVWAMSNPATCGDECDFGFMSPDGRQVVVVKGDTGVVEMFDPTSADGDPIWTNDLTGGTPAQIGTAWFGDGIVMLAMSDIFSDPFNDDEESAFRGIHVVDLETGRSIEYLPLEGCVVFVRPDQTAFGRDAPLIVGRLPTDPDTGRCDLTFATGWGPWVLMPEGIDGPEVPLQLPSPFSFVFLNPVITEDGSVAAVVNPDGVFVFDGASGEVIERYDGRRVDISKDGSRMLIQSDGYVELRSRETNAIERTFVGDFSRIYFSVEEDAMIGLPFDGSTVVVDLASGERLYELRGTGTRAIDTTLSKDGDSLLVYGREDSRIWTLVGDRSEITPPIANVGQRYVNSNEVFDSTFTAVYATARFTDSVVFIPTFDGDSYPYRLYDRTSGELIRESANLWGLARLSPDGTMIAEVPVMDETADAPDGFLPRLYGRLRVVDATTGSVIQVFEDTCPFFLDTLWVASPHATCDADSIPASVSDMEFSDDGTRLAVDTLFPQRDDGSFVRTPAVFSVETGRTLWRTEAIDSVIGEGGRIAISHDGSVVVFRSSGAPDWELTAVNIETGEILGTETGCSSTGEMVFSADGSTLYTADGCSDVVAYDTSSWTEISRVRRGQGSVMWDVAISGDLIAATGADRTLRVRNGLTNETLLEIELSSEPTNVEFLDPTHVIVLTSEPDPLVFTLDPAELMQIAGERLTRSFTDEECSIYGIDPCPTLEEIRTG